MAEDDVVLDFWRGRRTVVSKKVMVPEGTSQETNTELS